MPEEGYSQRGEDSAAKCIQIIDNDARYLIRKRQRDQRRQSGQSWFLDVDRSGQGRFVGHYLPRGKLIG